MSKLIILTLAIMIISTATMAVDKTMIDGKMSSDYVKAWPNYYACNSRCCGDPFGACGVCQEKKGEYSACGINSRCVCI